MAGNIDQNWVIMKNGQAIIGLFQGMFPQNMLTFNPGWDENGADVNPFDDVRLIQEHVKKSGVSLSAEADAKGSGPAHISFTDPDGNIILVDQHR